MEDLVFIGVSVKPVLLAVEILVVQRAAKLLAFKVRGLKKVCFSAPALL